MKKMKLAAVSAVLCLMLGVTAQAAGSSAGVIQVSQEPQTVSVRTQSGEVLENVQVIPVIKEGNQGVTAEEAQNILNFGDTNYVSYKLTVNLETLDGEEVELAEGSISVTFAVPGVTPSSKVAVIHWPDGGKQEVLPAAAGEGTVTATFTSFSPVEILVANETGSGDSGSGSSGSGSSHSGSSSSGSTNAAAASVSPKTSEGYELYAAAAVAAAALAGAVVFVRKARA